MTGRSCHAIELNPAYVDVSVKRWQAFTGEKAVLEADDLAFDDVAAGRASTISQAHASTVAAVERNDD